MSACQIPASSSLWTNLPSNSVLFQDNFSNPSSGWLNLPDDPLGARHYLGEYYRIMVNSSHSLLTSTPGLNFLDVHIYVTTLKKDGPVDDSYGILCRWQDSQNFYFHVISSDGYYGIGKVSNGSQMLLGVDKMLPSETINQGLGINHLRADCVGDALSLHVNGNHLITVIDNEFSSGDVGLLAGTFTEPGTEIIFSNFSVLKP